MGSQLFDTNIAEADIVWLAVILEADVARERAVLHGALVELDVDDLLAVAEDVDTNEVRRCEHRQRGQRVQTSHRSNEEPGSLVLVGKDRTDLDETSLNALDN